ncbi:hypothetical protein AO498_13690 [Algoriphagus sanaruensis]|uniref:DUF1574 domain-containing protein n=1 Tax=Algoriphagus sanaruensis TaxID=1727163 RepID=A0A142EQU0_9BACT|nr:hypothetical protein AO498_13690 [Algoriphagus sanaruensis]
MWIGLGVAFILGYGAFCDYFFQQRQYLDLSEKKQWILAQQGGSYDYAVLGSSRAFGAFDMNLLDSLTGLNGINLGANGSGFKDNYLILSVFLKSNQIKKLFLQVDMASLNSKTSFSNEFHAFTFMPFWEEVEIREVLKEEIPILANPLSSLAPQWRYFYFNKYFSPKEVIRRAKLSEKEGDNYFKSKGGISGKDKNQGEKQIKTYNLPTIADPVDWNYLIKIISKAEADGIEVVFFTAPRYQDRQEALVELLSILPNLKFFPEDFQISNVSLFVDQGHLSQEGRRQFTFSFYNAN